ncbi:AAA family ATPase [Bradyrhizobium pachyrhizi]|nr:AAA family ATPase [Bradyrhizobium pachyrhizi]
MAASFVKEILAEKAGVPGKSQSTLTNTLQELFVTFFPDKQFMGPQPTAEGALTFPVKTAEGHVHDLDELSAGEKEILYGYLRIRNSAPKNSIVILDEPELHLNPRLIRGLPQFYKKNLGEVLGNQMWLVTHSDALLREVVGRDGYNVFHMLPCSTLTPEELQVRPLKATADLDLALVDLVGDLAAYRPSGKVVIFEGGGDSDFDRRVTGALFPELHAKANLVSGTNKARVRALHETLESAAQQGQLPFQFFAVTDRDSTKEDIPKSSINVFNWDVYHIENYFLEVRYIRGVLRSLGLGTIPTEEQVLDDLRSCAIETLPQLIRHELAEFANKTLVRSINVGTDPKKGDLAMELHSAVNRSAERFQGEASTKLSLDAIRDKEGKLRTEFESNLGDGSWIKTFRGRDILRRFAGKSIVPIQYEVFRNLILSRMQDDGYQPKGMKEVIDKILEK